ncbi:hypothetical protein BDQ12DRAFT_409981 [Crucibulum laeve]|uniref:DUF6533 domain-containing protein n=1 Tax=Crucibulum laeve TaxID=68775 RepID=A0A5C3LKN4_9AGAR|nr:hypothetical protein BDQ12DRAFT_409981 [Crucibulum laeve]
MSHSGNDAALPRHPRKCNPRLSSSLPYSITHKYSGYLEVSLIWPSRWNTIKILYFLSRYLPLLDSIVIFYHQFIKLKGVEGCQVAYKINTWLFIAGGCITEMMLSLRTWAVWEKDLRLGMGLLIFFLIIWGSAAAVIAIFLKTMTFRILDYPYFTGCLNDGGSPILSIVWILLMVYDTVNLVLMAIKALKICEI